MRSFRHLIALTALIAGLGLTAHTASAATVRLVDGASGVDSSDCSAAPCRTIAWAVSQAVPGDTISVAAGTYTGLLQINESLSIVGAGEGQTILDGGGTGTVLTVTGGTVSVAGLTIQHGLAQGKQGSPTCFSGAPASGCLGNPGNDGAGGGIDFNGSALILTNTAVTGNMAQGGRGGDGGATYNCYPNFFDVGGNGGSGGSGLGGGIYMGAGTLTLKQSTITSNQATGGIGGTGGLGDCNGQGGAGGGGGNGLGANLFVAGGTVNIDASSITGGVATGGGGGTGGPGTGQAVAGGPGGTGAGGGLYNNRVPIQLTNSTLQSNQAVGGVGGDGSGSTTTGDFGGGGGFGNGGGIEDIGVSGGPKLAIKPFKKEVGVQLTGDALIGNSVTGGAAGQGLEGSDSGGPGSGGGLDVSAGTINVTNSTFSGNQATGIGGGNGLGGAVQLAGGHIFLGFDTISGNTATADSGGGAGYGGGLDDTVSGASVFATIGAGNTADPSHGPDCFGSIASSGYNILQNISGCEALATTGDQFGVDPGLLSLSEYGGPTQTFALSSTSTAVDQVPSGSCPKIDQRGLSRPDNGEESCDVGAYEFDELPAPVTTAFENPAPNAAGWNRSSVVVHLIAHPGTLAKGGLGPAVSTITYSATGTQNIAQTAVKGSSAVVPTITAEGITTLTYFATDVTGNLEVPKILAIKIDESLPKITGSPDRPPDSNGWYNRPVTFTWTCTDSGVPTVARPLARVTEPVGGGVSTGSGIASCSDSKTLSNEGRSQVVVGTVSDLAGNRNSDVISGINIDMHPPVTSAVVSPSPNGTGWNNTSPTVKLTALDPALSNGVNGSGVASITYSATGAQALDATTVHASSASIPLSTEGITTISFFATDVANNVETAKSIVVRYDHSAPTIKIDGVSNGGNYVASATPSVSISDPPPTGSSADTSGLLSHTLTLDGKSYTSGTSVSSNGQHTLVVVATDRAGNVAIRHVTFLVYSFPSRGAFILGDRTVSGALVASNPPTVTFFGPQWVTKNSLSGGAAPAGFQGFVTQFGSASCDGSGWNSSSAAPPSPLPGYMAVLVTSKASKSGDTVSGSYTELAIVKTNSALNGTGKVVAIVRCAG